MAASSSSSLAYERIHRPSLEIEQVPESLTPTPEMRRSWLLRPSNKTQQSRMKISMEIKMLLAVATLLTVVFLVVMITVEKTVPTMVHHHHHHHHHQPPPDNYAIALGRALMFFNAQLSGKLPSDNNISWRGDSCLKDGRPDAIRPNQDLVGGYYDGGDSIKFHFPSSFAMTTLSWSVIEYSSKYEAAGELQHVKEAAGELQHVKEIIRWGTDYFLKCFDSTAPKIPLIAAQVGNGGNRTVPNEHYCWMRPEDIDYVRPVTVCTRCSDLAAEMAAALASASIVFKNDTSYSRKLVHGARALFEFSRSRPGRYSTVGSDAELFYNSTSYWDEYVWGATWLFYATGEWSYLSLATDPEMAKRAGAFTRGPDYGVFSWDNNLVGAQVLLLRLRLLLDPGFPYEEILMTYHDKINRIMCSYLPFFHTFNRTKGGLIQLNHGKPRPLQYVANAAFIATVYADYLAASNTPGWYCGPTFYKLAVLREFAETQIQYILGKNPRNMSYIVGFGDRFPLHVHHRAASIPMNNIKYGCEQGKVWRDTPKPNPNIIIGALVGGPDRYDGFHDVRENYNYTEPTLGGNADLVAALVALSGADKTVGIDEKTIFSNIPPMYPMSPPPPPPWTP